jgi:SPP1 gp7 family putative phage head morphogenesis protein
MVEDVQRELAAATTLAQAQRLGFRLTAIQDLIREGITALGSDLTQNLDEFASFEADFAVKAIEAAGDKVTAVLPRDSVLAGIATQRPMSLLRGEVDDIVTLDQALKKFANNKADEVRRIIQAGFVQGKTGQQITRDVTRLIKHRARNQSEALVRTAVNHFSSEARAATHAANSDILEGEEWVSTLDGRTTITCASLDGKVFDLDQGPTVPRHWNCRSVRVPVLKKDFQVLGKGGTRASMHGQVSAKRTYSGWLRDQPAEFQDSVLGAERGKLFRSGGFSVDRFTDDSGKVLDNLDQLRALTNITLQ